MAKKYKPILPGSQDWPVVRFAKSRDKFIEEVYLESFEKLKKNNPSRESLIEELELTLFSEKLRIKQNPWPVDPEDEKKFWDDIKSRLMNLPKGEAENAIEEAEEDKILKDILKRYVSEIAGNFRPSRYKLARAIITFGLTRFLNAARLKGFSRFFKNELSLLDKMHITGAEEQIRNLAKKGTIILVPTHFSNIDSVIIGWVIHTLGLPPFIYGAGLNLFNMNLFAYFMNSLGAYKIDRRKKNRIYLEALKTYSKAALGKGVHSLFFPGGTRSRSGKIEKHLKLGLLNTAIEAQRKNFQNNAPDENGKIFIVPMTLNYNFVLEAPALIKDYLKKKGQERYYIEKDKYTSSLKIMNYIFKFMTKGSDISVSIGKPMDIFGHYVDDNGDSYDKNGRIINQKDYFLSKDQVTEDSQRESVYTKMLSEKIVAEFHRINKVTPSHLTAFVAFQMFKKRHRKLDLFDLLRLPEEELIINFKEFKKVFSKLQGIILNYKKLDKIDVEENIKSEEVESLIYEGIKNCGMYHDKRPIYLNRNGNISTKNINTLYYYSNRMVGYGFEKYV